MPLSEQEQRLLDEMERNLYQNDADFVATVGAGRGRTNYRGIILGAVLVVVGVVTLLVGVGSRLPVVGVLGFLVMFAGVFLALTPARRPKAGLQPESHEESPRAQAKRSSGFMDNLNDRWERRQDGTDG
jgi:hypothetical protein